MKLKKYCIFNKEGLLLNTTAKESHIKESLLDSRGLLLMQNENGGSNGILDYKNGEKILANKFSWIEPLTEDYIIAGRKKDDIIIIDNKGDIQLQLKEIKRLNPEIIKIQLSDDEVSIIDNQLRPLVANLTEIGVEFHEKRMKIRNKENKYGFIDEKGNVVIPCRYDYIYDFEGGIAIAYLNDKCGVIDLNGRIIVDFKYDEIESFNVGLAKFKINNRYGYLNEKGKVEIEPVFESAYSFEKCGVAIVKKEGEKYGLINNVGKYIIPPIYDSSVNIISHSFRHQYGFIPIKNIEGKYGVINENGEVVIPFIYDELIIPDYWHEPMVLSVLNKKYGLIDFNGNTILDPVYDNICEYGTQNLLWVCFKKLKGIITRQGEVIIPCEYNEISKEINGLITVKNNALYGLFSSTGEKISEVVLNSVWYINKFLVGAQNLLTGKNIIFNREGKVLFDNASISLRGFQDGMAAIKIGGKYGYINENGELLINPEYDSFNNFCNGYAVVKKDDKEGLINRQGDIIIDCKYNILIPFSGKQCIYKLKDNWGIIEENGEIIKITEKEEDRISKTGSEKLLSLRQNGKIGFINTKGELIVKPVYDDFRSFINGLCPVSKNGEWGIINENGEEILKPQFLNIIQIGKNFIKTENF